MTLRGLGLIVLLGSAAHAADEPRVSIQAVGQSLRAVLDKVAEETGRPIRVDDRIMADPITLDLRGKRLAEALDLICRAAGLVWYRQEGAYIVSLEPTRRVQLPDLGDVPQIALRYPAAPLARTVTLALLEVPVRDAFRALQEPTGTVIEIDPGVPYDLHVSASFQDTPLSRCLAMLCTAGGLYLRVTPEMRLRVCVPVRVAVTRADRETAVVIEHYPADFRGVLGYLFTDAFWAAPERYRSRVVGDPQGQPIVQPLDPAP